jgi:hypothetical protein
MTPHRWLLVIVLFVLAMHPCHAFAQEPEELELLAVAVAKVSFNEALDNQDDLGLVWMVTEGRSSTTKGRLRWLQCHSTRVLGRPGCLRAPKVCREGRNCWWTRNLSTDGAEPAGWPYSAAYWRTVTRRRWLVHLERTRWLVAGKKRHRPCPGETPPTTWGGPDSMVLLDLGWTAATCGGALNAAYWPPGRR